MSRMGAKPIIIPENTEVMIDGNTLKCKGKSGENTIKISPRIKIEKKDNTVLLTRSSNDKISKSLHGSARKLILNALAGVNEPYQKTLEVIGIGYRIKVSGKDLELSLGFSHPVKVAAPQGIEFKVVKNSIIVTGIDKQLVGQTAANIRALKKPEPYKGKGIKYKEEIVKRKAGKTAKAAGAEK
jgi:large subunit ribosomal protein L6